MRDLDIHNLEKDMLFSDLEDDDEPEVRITPPEGRKDSCKSLNDS